MTGRTMPQRQALKSKTRASYFFYGSGLWRLYWYLEAIDSFSCLPWIFILWDIVIDILRSNVKVGQKFSDKSDLESNIGKLEVDCVRRRGRMWDASITIAGIACLDLNLYLVLVPEGGPINSGISFLRLCFAFTPIFYL